MWSSTISARHMLLISRIINFFARQQVINLLPVKHPSQYRPDLNPFSKVTNITQNSPYFDCPRIAFVLGFLGGRALRLFQW